MVYLDTSCLLKLLRPEPLSDAVRNVISKEESVIVSVLSELEIVVQLKAFWMGGAFTRNEWRYAETRFNVLRNEPPFEFRRLPAAIFQTALRQHLNSGDKLSRSLDRLHLAAMEELGVSRLMTHDVGQAQAAIETGFEVICPGRH
jgi:predicted nucleic acid-binding protein